MEKSRTIKGEGKGTPDSMNVDGEKIPYEEFLKRKRKEGEPDGED